jgi:polyisoprenyl-phosphate glycosyltransferase
MISVVVPCYNEAEVLRATYQALADAAAGWGEPAELLFVDDGSTDETWPIVQWLSACDERVRGLQLSRNFGHQAAVGAGLQAARGDAVVVTDADLQDPPELIARLIAKWREGYDVVYGRRVAHEGISAWKRVTASLFYRLFDRLCETPIPHDAGDFALMDARVVRQILASGEHALFWRGLRCWAGFKHAGVPFTRRGRAAGKTKYPLGRMLRFALDAICSFSRLPLRFPAYVGAAVLLGTLLGACVSLGGWLLWPAGGWWVSPGVLATLFLGSVQLIALGVIGEYLARIYDEVRARPRWIVRTTTDEPEPWSAAVHRRVESQGTAGGLRTDPLAQRPEEGIAGGKRR